MKLHYSQTELFYFRSLFLFYIPMKLHYSQTAYGNQIMYSRFYIPMKLHYSQTTDKHSEAILAVLYPYEITLLSNKQQNLKQ